MLCKAGYKPPSFFGFMWGLIGIGLVDAVVRQYVEKDVHVTGCLIVYPWCLVHLIEVVFMDT